MRIKEIVITVFVGLFIVAGLNMIIPLNTDEASAEVSQQLEYKMVQDSYSFVSDSYDYGMNYELAQLYSEFVPNSQYLYNALQVSVKKQNSESLRIAVSYPDFYQYFKDNYATVLPETSKDVPKSYEELVKLFFSTADLTLDKIPVNSITTVATYSKLFTIVEVNDLENKFIFALATCGFSNVTDSEIETIEDELDQLRENLVKKEQEAAEAEALRIKTEALASEPQILTLWELADLAKTQPETVQGKHVQVHLAIDTITNDTVIPIAFNELKGVFKFNFDEPNVSLERYTRESVVTIGGLVDINGTKITVNSCYIDPVSDFQPVDISSMFDIARSNNELARSMYIGKPIRFTGVVEDSYPEDGNLNVWPLNMQDTYYVMHMSCFTNNIELVTQISNLNVGDLVTVTGIVYEVINPVGYQITPVSMTYAGELTESQQADLNPFLFAI